MANPAAIAAAGSAVSDLIKSTPEIISAGQEATEKRKWGKQKRKQDQSEWERSEQQLKYQNLLKKDKIEEHLAKTELDEVKNDSSLMGRWNNESRLYNTHKNQVESDLRNKGAIKSEKYKSGKTTKTRDVYASDINQQRDALYEKYTGQKLTKDANAQYIGAQKWGDVDKVDEQILAGELEDRKKKNAARKEKVRDAESRFYEAKGDLDSNLLTDDDFKLFGVNNREAFKNKYFNQTEAHSSKNKTKNKAYGVNGNASETNKFM